jgi:AcrR family transcriptional regulator
MVFKRPARLEAVATRAGVSRGSIYGNFRDRNDLIAAVGAERAPRVFPAPTRRRPAHSIARRRQVHRRGRAATSRGHDLLIDIAAFEALAGPEA